MSQHPRHICFKALVAFILAVAFVISWFGSARAIPTSLSKLNVVRPGSESTSIFHRINLREAAPREELGGQTSDGPSHTEKARFKRQDETDGDKPEVKDGETDNSAKDDDSGPKDDTSNTGETDSGTKDEDSHSDTKGNAKIKAPIFEVKKFEFDLSNNKGTFNGEEVILVGKKYEPGLDQDPEKIWTKYIVARTSDKQKVGFLRVADLRVARKLQVEEAVKAEGKFARKMKDKMYMWSRHVGNHYAVMYRYIRGDELKFMPEWASQEDWAEKKMLSQCKTGMMKKQEEMVKYLAIDRIGLFSWVTDKECKDWYPVEAPPRFEYINKKWSTVDMRGAQTLDEKERDGYLKKVQERVEKSFTTTRLKEAKEKLKDKKPFDSAFK